MVDGGENHELIKSQAEHHKSKWQKCIDQYVHKRANSQTHVVQPQRQPRIEDEHADDPPRISPTTV